MSDEKTDYQTEPKSDETVTVLAQMIEALAARTKGALVSIRVAKARGIADKKFLAAWALETEKVLADLVDGFEIILPARGRS